LLSTRLQAVSTYKNVSRLPIVSRISLLSTMVRSKPQPAERSTVLIFGAGNFGSCLASHLGDSQHDVFMWAKEKKLVEHFNAHQRNLFYLPDHHFPKNITAVGPDLPTKEFIAKMDVLIFAIPTQFLRCA
jgi:NAD-dependent glycerol-3-phosphate dehydrogenase N-terminus